MQCRKKFSARHHNGARFSFSSFINTPARLAPPAFSSTETLWINAFGKFGTAEGAQLGLGRCLRGNIGWTQSPSKLPAVVGTRWTICSAAETQARGLKRVARQVAAREARQSHFGLFDCCTRRGRAKACVNAWLALQARRTLQANRRPTLGWRPDRDDIIRDVENEKKSGNKFVPCDLDLPKRVIGFATKSGSIC